MLSCAAANEGQVCHVCGMRWAVDQMQQSRVVMIHELLVPPVNLTLLAKLCWHSGIPALITARHACCASRCARPTVRCAEQGSCDLTFVDVISSTAQQNGIGIPDGIEPALLNP